MENTIPIPEGVNVKLENSTLVVSGPKGELSREFRQPRIKINLGGKEIKLSAECEDRHTGAIMGTWAAHLRNMFKGVTHGWKASLKVVYSHFPIKVTVEGNSVVIQNFMGERMPRVAKIFGDAKVEVKKDEVMVTGLDRESVGQTCGNIELAAKVMGRDRRVFQDGIFITGKPVAVEEGE